MTKRNKKEEQKQEETRKLEKAREALRASGNGAMILYGEYLTESIQTTNQNSLHGICVDIQLFRIY